MRALARREHSRRGRSASGCGEPGSCGRASARAVVEELEQRGLARRRPLRRRARASARRARAGRRGDPRSSSSATGLRPRRSRRPWAQLEPERERAERLVGAAERARRRLVCWPAGASTRTSSRRSRCTRALSGVRIGGLHSTFCLHLTCFRIGSLTFDTETIDERERRETSSSGALNRVGEARAPRLPIRACPGACGAGWAPRYGADNGSRPSSARPEVGSAHGRRHRDRHRPRSRSRALPSSGSTRSRARARRRRAARASCSLTEAKREAEALRREAQIEAREDAVRFRAEVEQELGSGARRSSRSRSASLAKEEDIDRKLTELTRREQGIADREMHTKQLQEELKEARGLASSESSSASRA